jgi:hypothetical protein
LRCRSETPGGDMQLLEASRSARGSKSNALTIPVKCRQDEPAAPTTGSSLPSSISSTDPNPISGSAPG